MSLQNTSDTAKALLFLHTRSFINRLRAQLVRARNPRYLVAIIVSCLYLWWILFQDAAVQPGRYRESFFTSTYTSVVGSAVLLLFGMKWWLFKTDRSTLAFIPAEVQFLFPAPISRKHLIHAKLIRMQAIILINTLIFTIVLRGGANSIDSWKRGLSLWVLITTMSLHRLAAGIVRSSVVEHGSAGRRRALVPFGVYSFLIGVIVYSVLVHLPELSAARIDGFQSTIKALVGILKTPPASLALLPTRALVTSVLNATGSQWGSSIVGALIVLIVHYVWILRLDVAFEDAALEATRHRFERLQRLRSTQMGQARSRKGALTALPALKPQGRPEVAIIWKNIAAALRGGGWQRQLLLFPGIILVFAIITLRKNTMPIDFFFGMIGGWIAMLLVLGPGMIRFDLRLDLPQLAVLKTFPISGRRLVMAEVAGGTILHTITIWSLIAIPAFIVLRGLSNPIGTESPGAFIVALLLSIPALNALFFTIHNGTALLFPAWVRLGVEPGRFEAMGQNMLTMGATTLAALVALVFPIGLGALAFWLTHGFGVWIALMTGVLTGVAVLIAELGPALYWLGSVFERIEVGEVVGQAAASSHSA